jgi:peptidoglycan/LPS O-acetylase OafA/YrhL
MHLTPYTATLGYWAVLSFYVLSGYLMTFVLRTSYTYNSDGLKRFFLNRLLRIFPPYWIACLFSATVISFVPSLALSMNQGLSWPDSAHEFFLNIAILGHIPPSEVSRLVPPVWTLHVELVFYICIALFLTKTDRRIIIWLVVSVLGTIVLNLRSPTFNDFVQNCYFSTVAGSLPFSIGAFVFLIRSRLKIPETILPRSTLIYIGLTVLLILGLGLLSKLYDHFQTNSLFRILYYSGLVASGFFVLISSFLRVPHSWLMSLDKLLGDYSYPIYLVHLPVAVLTTAIIGEFGWTLERGFFLFLLTLLVSVIFSELIRRFVDTPIDRLRGQIKGRRR